jgi:YD repeat-containing protein
MRIALIAALTTLPAMAQNYLYGTGNPVWGINIPIENGFINVANGNVHLEFHLANQPQLGHTLALDEKIVYDSRIWQIVPSVENGHTYYKFWPTNVPNSWDGWRFVASDSGSVTQITPVSLSVPCSGSGGNQTYMAFTYTWTDQSGTNHQFAPGTVVLTGTTCPYGNTQNIVNVLNGTAYATDGSGYFAQVFNQTYTTSPVLSYGAGVLVYDPKGNIIENNGAEFDPNGNMFGVDGNANPANSNLGNLVDTLGNTPVLATTNGSNQYYYDVLTVGGGRKQYTLTYEEIQLKTGFGQSGVIEGSTTSQNPMWTVQSLGLPDGTSYTFHYDTEQYPSTPYGELTEIDLPTGGAVKLAYQNYTDSYGNVNRWIRSYSGGNGSYTFAPSVLSASSCPSPNQGCEQMKVTDGNQNQVVYKLTLNSGAWNTQADYYNYNPNTGTLTDVVSTATVNQLQNGCPTNVCTGAWLTQAKSTTTLLDTGQIAQSKYIFEHPGYGKPDKVQQWDYYTGTPSATPTKETDYTYGTLVNGAAYVTNILQLNSSGTPAAQTAFTYDASGDLTSVLSGLQALGYPSVFTSSTYDGSGSKLSDVDNALNTTSYSHMCSDAYPSTVTFPVIVSGTSLQSSTVYDCSSGAVTSTTDMNLRQTTYSYDGIGRLQTVTYPDGGSTTYSYPSATETDQVTAQGSSNVTSKAILDAYGRKYQTITVAPEGPISSETTYDATGRPSSVTNPHLQRAISPTDGATTTYYDVLGRITKVVASDGSSTTTSTPSGNSQTVTDPRSHSKKYTYDAFHRLTSVLEPNSSGVPTYETDYQYNALDQLIQVDQWGGAKGSTSPGDRQRLFNYDSLGRLVGTGTPESGTVAYKYDVGHNLTCAGDPSLPCSKTDARGVVTTYAYDALNRILSKTYSNATPAACFQYDTPISTASDSNPKGLLTLEWTQTGSCPSSSSLQTAIPSGALTSTAVLAHDAMGRLKSEQQCIASKCTSTTPYTLSYGYDLAGNPVSLTNSVGAAGGPLVLTTGFDEAARMNSVTSNWGAYSTNLFTIAPSSGYGPVGPLNWTLGPNLSVTQGYTNRLWVNNIKANGQVP